MNAWGLQILAAVSAIVVALLALLDRGRSPFRLPLTMLAFNQFTWNAASVGQELTGDPRSASVGIAAAPLFAPVALHYVLTFVGRRQRFDWLLKLTYGAGGARRGDRLCAAWGLSHLRGDAPRAQRAHRGGSMAHERLAAPDLGGRQSKALLAGWPGG